MRYYRKNQNNDFYQLRLEDNPIVWIIVTFALMVLCIAGLIKGYSFGGLLAEVATISGLIFLVLTIYQVVVAKKMLGTYKRILSYLLNYDRVQVIQTWILNARNSTGMVSKSYKVMPKIWLYYEKNTFYIKVQKLSDKDAEKVGLTIISPALGDNFIVASSAESRDQDWYEFVCPRFSLNRKWTPRTLDEFTKIDPYSIKLMNDVIIEQDKLPHIAIFGLTGSRKTSLLLTILEEKIACADCYFLDGKSELSVFKTFYPEKRFAVNEEEVTALLQQLIKQIKERQLLINKKVIVSEKVGLTAKGAKLKPIYLFIDEFASIKARFSKPNKKKLDDLMAQILMQSRSAGVYVVYASQAPNAEGGLNTQSRSQFGTYVLLGSANAETQRMVFDTTVTTGRVSDGEGFYLEKISQMPNPEFIEIPDTYKHDLNQLSTFKKLYMKGKNHVIS